MATILLYGDTIRHPAVRHEVPLEIMDPLLFVVRDGRALVLTSSLERERVARALPSAELVMSDELGFLEPSRRAWTGIRRRRRSSCGRCAGGESPMRWSPPISGWRSPTGCGARASR